jgi:transposase InsO family protein
MDLVARSGNSEEGEFAYTLNVTDVYNGWTESRAVLGRGQAGVVQALEEIAQAPAFHLLGIDTDNGSEFPNWHLGRWCAQRRIQFRRGRPYKKDDNAHIGQKNYTRVRKLMGWERDHTGEAVEALTDLYREELCLWMNVFQPWVKLIGNVGWAPACVESMRRRGPRWRGWRTPGRANRKRWRDCTLSRRIWIRSSLIAASRRNWEPFTSWRTGG